MIIKGLFNLIYTFLSVILTPFEIIPNMPATITTQTNNFIDFVFTPINLCLWFFDVYYLRVAIPIIILIANMEHVWDGIMWVMKKLPFVGIE